MKPTKEEMLTCLACFEFKNINYEQCPGNCGEKRKAIRALIEKYEDGGPRIICLCGSTRFTREMMIKQWELTKQGRIVLSWCVLPDDYYDGEDKAHIGDQERVKEIVDEVHKRKIDLAGEVFIINVGGYVGDSTKSEIKYAVDHGKSIRWLEPESSADILRSIGVQVEE